MGFDVEAVISTDFLFINILYNVRWNIITLLFDKILHPCILNNIIILFTYMFNDKKLKKIFYEISINEYYFGTEQGFE